MLPDLYGLEGSYDMQGRPGCTGSKCDVSCITGLWATCLGPLATARNINTTLPEGQNI